MLEAIYNSGDYPFFYATLVSDKNLKARQRLIDDYNLYGVPTVFFDGGYKVVIGGQSTQGPYRTAITACGLRPVHDLDLSVRMDWMGDAKLLITVRFTNKEVIGGG